MIGIHSVVGLFIEPLRVSQEIQVKKGLECSKSVFIHSIIHSSFTI